MACSTAVQYVKENWMDTFPQTDMLYMRICLRQLQLWHLSSHVNTPPVHTSLHHTATGTCCSCLYHFSPHIPPNNSSFPAANSATGLLPIYHHSHLHRSPNTTWCSLLGQHHHFSLPQLYSLTVFVLHSHSYGHLTIQYPPLCLRTLTLCNT